jgi:hypothetical protein
MERNEGGESMKKRKQGGTLEMKKSPATEQTGIGIENLPDFIKNDPEWMEIFHQSKGIIREAPSGTMRVKIIMRDDYPDEKKKK